MRSAVACLRTWANRDLHDERRARRDGAAVARKGERFAITDINNPARAQVRSRKRHHVKLLTSLEGAIRNTDNFNHIRAARMSSMDGRGIARYPQPIGSKAFVMTRRRISIRPGNRRDRRRSQPWLRRLFRQHARTRARHSSCARGLKVKTVQSKPGLAFHPWWRAGPGVVFRGIWTPLGRLPSRSLAHYNETRAHRGTVGAIGAPGGLRSALPRSIRRHEQSRSRR